MYVYGCQHVDMGLKCNITGFRVGHGRRKWTDMNLVWSRLDIPVLSSGLLVTMTDANKLPSQGMEARRGRASRPPGLMHQHISARVEIQYDTVILTTAPNKHLITGL